MKITAFCLGRISILTAPIVMAQIEQGFSAR